MEDLLKLEKQICFPVYAFSRELTNLYRPLLDKLDITYPQYLVLLVLWGEKEKTVNQLGEKLRLDSGTLTPMLKRLEQKELVHRNRSKQDERVVLISLTAKGVKLREQAKEIPMKIVECLDVTMEELLQLKNILNKMLKI